MQAVDQTAEVERLKVENAYLRRTLEQVSHTMPYRDARRGGCASARRMIRDAQASFDL